jgi:hypothetical protein
MSRPNKQASWEDAIQVQPFLNDRLKRMPHHSSDVQKPSAPDQDRASLASATNCTFNMMLEMLAEWLGRADQETRADGGKT